MGSEDFISDDEYDLDLSPRKLRSYLSLSSSLLLLLAAKRFLQTATFLFLPTKRLKTF
jgi:hypothetical protein